MKNITINYHNAHIDGFAKKKSPFEILDKKEGLVKLHNAFVDNERDVIVKFRPKGTEIIEYSKIAKEYIAADRQKKLEKHNEEILNDYNEKQKNLKSTAEWRIKKIDDNYRGYYNDELNNIKNDGLIYEKPSKTQISYHASSNALAGQKIDMINYENFLKNPEMVQFIHSEFDRFCTNSFNNYQKNPYKPEPYKETTYEEYVKNYVPSYYIIKSNACYNDKYNQYKDNKKNELIDKIITYEEYYKIEKEKINFKLNTELNEPQNSYEYFINNNKLEYDESIALRRFYKDFKYSDDNSLDKYSESSKYKISLEIDNHSEIVVINYKIPSGCSYDKNNIAHVSYCNPYTYNSNSAYYIENANSSSVKNLQNEYLKDDPNIAKPFFDFGTIIYQDGMIPKLLSLMNDNLAQVLDLQRGFIKVKVCKSDNQGYVMILPPEMARDLLLQHDKMIEEREVELDAKIKAENEAANIFAFNEFDIDSYPIKSRLENIEGRLSDVYMTLCRIDSYNAQMEYEKYEQTLEVPENLYRYDVEKMIINRDMKVLMAEILDDINYDV